MSLFTNAGHLDQDVLSLRVLGDLPGRWVATVEDHLSRCSHCQLESVEIGKLVDALRMLAKPSQRLNRRVSMAN